MVDQTGKSLRDAAGEVDPCQVLGGGDGVPKHGAVGGQELDDVGGKAALPQDPVDRVARQDGRVTGLPQDHVTLSLQITEKETVRGYRWLHRVMGMFQRVHR